MFLLDCPWATATESPHSRTHPSAGLPVLFPAVSQFDVSEPEGPVSMLQALDGHSDRVYSVDFHPKMPALASGSADGIVITTLSHLWFVLQPIAPATCCSRVQRSDTVSPLPVFF